MKYPKEVLAFEYTPLGMLVVACDADKHWLTGMPWVTYYYPTDDHGGTYSDHVSTLKPLTSGAAEFLEAVTNA